MYQTDFSKDEFKRRREDIYQSIGDKALALICGSDLRRRYSWKTLEKSRSGF